MNRRSSRGEPAGQRHPFGGRPVVCSTLAGGHLYHPRAPGALDQSGVGTADVLLLRAPCRHLRGDGEVGDGRPHDPSTRPVRKATIVALRGSVTGSRTRSHRDSRSEEPWQHVETLLSPGRARLSRVKLLCAQEADRHGQEAHYAIRRLPRRRKRCGRPAGRRPGIPRGEFPTQTVPAYRRKPGIAADLHVDYATTSV